MSQDETLGLASLGMPATLVTMTPLRFVVIAIVACSCAHAAEDTADPGQNPAPHVYFRQQQPPNDDKPDKKKSMLEMLKSVLPGGVLPSADQDAKDINKQYDDAKKNGTLGEYTPGEGSTFFSKAAQECGEAKEKECSPANFGGRTMCGLAVAKMIKCMSPVIGGKDGCVGGCGNGKDYVNCSNGQMEKCGYAKLPPTDNRCKLAGAVLSYTQTPTARGSVYGHVEFLCGNNRFCSVYNEPHDHPWPRYPADACWYPASQVSKGGGS
jgi:hypothetical protein